MVTYMCSVLVVTDILLLLTNMQQYVTTWQSRGRRSYMSRPSGTFKADTCLLEKGKWRTARQQVSCTEVYGSSQVKHMK